MDPRRLFWLIAGARLVVWTLLPSLLASSAPLDVIEGLAWGREWQWGYWKHPPLPAWLLEATVAVFGARLWPIFLVSQIVVLACLWAVWRLAHELVGPAEALVAVFLLEGIQYFNFSSPKLNPDLLELPLWALAALALLAAVKRGRTLAWAALGLSLGLTLLAKYYSIALIVSLLIPLGLADGRSQLRRRGPYLAAVIAIGIVAPHLLWLARHDFPPMRYAWSRTHEAGPLADHLTQPLLFAASQLLVLLPVSLLLWAAGWRPRRLGRVPRSCAEWVPVAAGLGPFLLTLLLSATLGLRLVGTSREAWGTPLWSFIGVLLVAHGELKMTEAGLTRFLRAWAAVFAAAAAAYVLAIMVAPGWSGSGKRETFPGAALATRIGEAWHARCGGPLPLVAGNVWLAGNVSFFSKDRPAVYIDLDSRRSPWVDDEELRRRGGAIVWDAAHPEASDYERAMRERFPRAELQPVLTLVWRAWNPPRPFRLGWAILPPETRGTLPDRPAGSEGTVLHSVGHGGGADLRPGPLDR